jgi:hypothetical protein
MREVSNYHIQCLFQKDSNLTIDKKVEPYKKNFEQILEDEINRIES